MSLTASWPKRSGPGVTKTPVRLCAPLRSSEGEEQQYQARLAALQPAVDEGDASGIAAGIAFGRVRKALKLSGSSRCGRHWPLSENPTWGIICSYARSTRYDCCLSGSICFARSIDLLARRIQLAAGLRVY